MGPPHINTINIKATNKNTDNNIVKFFFITSLLAKF
jgi:hypothetical protein